MDIKFIKECRAMKRMANINIQYLQIQIAIGNMSPKLVEKATHLISVYEDQKEMADSMIHDELCK